MPKNPPPPPLPPPPPRLSAGVDPVAGALLLFPILPNKFDVGAVPGVVEDVPAPPPNRPDSVVLVLFVVLPAVWKMEEDGLDVDAVVCAPKRGVLGFVPPGVEAPLAGLFRPPNRPGPLDCVVELVF